MLIQRKLRDPFSLRSLLSLFAAGALFLLITKLACPQETSPDQLFSITPAANVDENLFALRVLAYVYASWPDKTKSHKELSTWLSNTRAFTSGMRGLILSRRLDPNIDVAYQNCLTYLSATASYLSALDDIDSQTSTQAGLDVFSSLWTAVSKGSDASSLAKKVMSNENAANAGKVVGAFSGLADYSQRSTTRQNAAKAAISEQQRKLEDVWNTTWAATEGTSRELTAKYGWAPGEAGFNGFQSPNIEDSLRRYPRDPFVKAKYGDSLGASNDPGQLQQAAYVYLQAAQLVPANNAYDNFRLQFISEAVLYSADAASAQAGANFSEASHAHELFITVGPIIRHENTI